MAKVHLEIEAKYDADSEFRMPDLVEMFGSVRGHDGAPPADGTPWAEGEHAQERLRATYFDTPQLDLAAAGLTLRRRTGGPDAGWHLKVPAGDQSRSEVREPLGRGVTRVPPRLVSMTYALTEGRELLPVARITTDRTVRRLIDATGRVLVEVADDRVTASRILPSQGPGEALGAPTTWREIEVELVDGPAGLLGLVDPVLRAGGLAPAAATSKLNRVLGSEESSGRAPDRAGTTARRKARGKTQSRKSAPAAGTALAHIGTQVAQIRSQDLPVRLDAPGAVHAMRVASRRLRSALTTFEPLFDPTVTRPIGKELRWLAGVLGAARDAEVMRDRVTAAVGKEQDGARLHATVTGEVSGELDDAYRAAHDEVLAQLDGDRYRALLDALHLLMEQPPLKDRARRPAGEVLPRLVAKSDTRVRAAMKAARTTDDPVRREELLHDARKAAKRARYAAESVTPVFGKDARKFAVAMEGFQETLGEHLDSLNTSARLVELAAHTTQPSTAFTYGRLHALEESHAERSRARADHAWATAQKKRLRTWLT